MKELKSSSNTDETASTKRGWPQEGPQLNISSDITFYNTSKISSKLSTLKKAFDRLARGTVECDMNIQHRGLCSSHPSAIQEVNECSMSGHQQTTIRLLSDNSGCPPEMHPITYAAQHTLGK